MMTMMMMACLQLEIRRIKESISTKRYDYESFQRKRSISPAVFVYNFF